MKLVSFIRGSAVQGSLDMMEEFMLQSILAGNWYDRSNAELLRFSRASDLDHMYLGCKL